MVLFYVLVVQCWLIGYFSNDLLWYKIGGINAGVLFLVLIVGRLCCHKEKSSLTEESTDKQDSHSSHLNEIKNKEEKNAKKSDKHPTYDLETEEETPNKAEEKAHEHHEKENRKENKQENQSEEKQEPKKKPRYAETMLRNNLYQISHPAENSRKRHKKHYFGHWILFLVSLAVAGAVFYISYEFLATWAYILAIIVGFFFFVIIGKMLDLGGFHKISTLGSSRCYYLLIVFFIAYSGVNLYGDEAIMQKIDQYIPISQLKEIDFLKYDPSIKASGIKIQDNIALDQGKGIIIQPETVSTGTLETWEQTTSDITSWMNLEISGNSLTSTEDLNNVNQNTGTPLENKNITFLEAIKYLIDQNHISLSKKTTTTFDYMKKTDPDYAYFETARSKGLIGKNAQPNKELSCDTYIVMKGLIEGRNVGSYTDIKSTYRNKAQSLGKLNGCEKWKIVTTQTL